MLAISAFTKTSKCWFQGLQYALLKKPHTPYSLFSFVPGPQVDQTSPTLLYLVYSKTPFKEDSAELRTEELRLGVKERT